MNTDITTIPAQCDIAIAALAEARTIEDVLKIKNRAAVLRDMAERHGKEAVSLRNRCQEVVLLAEARIGKELEAAQERGELAKRGNRTGSNQHTGGNVPAGNISSQVTLKDIGMSRKEAMNAKHMADAGEAAIREEARKATEERRTLSRKDVAAAKAAERRQGKAKPKPQQDTPVPIEDEAPAGDLPLPATLTHDFIDRIGREEGMVEGGVRGLHAMLDALRAGRPFTQGDFAAVAGTHERTSSTWLRHFRLMARALATVSEVPEEPPRAWLTLSAQEKLERVLAGERKRMSRDFGERVAERAERYLAEDVLPALVDRAEKLLRDLENLDYRLSKRGNRIPRVHYRQAVACLHADRNNGGTEATNAAYLWFQDAKSVLSDDGAPLEVPQNRATFDQLKARAAAVRDAVAQRRRGETIARFNAEEAARTG